MEERGEEARKGERVFRRQCRSDIYEGHREGRCSKKIWPEGSQRCMLEEAYHSMNRCEPIAVSLLCLVIGWELPREGRGLAVDPMAPEGWLLGLSVNCAPTAGDLSSTLSWLPAVWYLTGVKIKV